MNEKRCQSGPYQCVGGSVKAFSAPSADVRSARGRAAARKRLGAGPAEWAAGPNWRQCRQGRGAGRPCEPPRDRRGFLTRCPRAIQAAFGRPLLDGTNLGVGEGPGAHGNLKLGPIEALSAGDGSRQAGQGFLQSAGLCLLNRIVERLDHQSFVRAKEGPLEVAGSSEVVVKRAFADTEPTAEPINAETVWAIVGHSCKPGLEPVRTGRHTVTIPYGMVWSMKW